MQKPERGIYRITCLPNGWNYVGSAMGSVGERWKAHIGCLERQVHTNRGLQADWLRFGRDMFEFGIVELVPRPPLDQRGFDTGGSWWLLRRERYWICQAHLVGHCYNVRFSLKRCQRCGNDRRHARPVFTCRCADPIFPAPPTNSPPKPAEPAIITHFDPNLAVEYLNRHAYFGYALGRADVVSVLLSETKKQTLDALAECLGGKVLGPYQHPGCRAFVWRARAGALPSVVALLEASLPPGPKREQFEEWKRSYVPQEPKQYELPTDCGYYNEVVPSSSGYQAHRHAGEIACTKCRSAHAMCSREYKRARQPVRGRGRRKREDPNA